jgi:hypothetical protein
MQIITRSKANMQIFTRSKLNQVHGLFLRIKCTKRGATLQLSLQLRVAQPSCKLEFCNLQPLPPLGGVLRVASCSPLLRYRQNFLGFISEWYKRAKFNAFGEHAIFYTFGRLGALCDW